MAIFTHIFPESERSGIERNGIRIQRMPMRPCNGVFLMPVTENYVVTQQCYREMHRHRNVPKLAVRVRLPDQELVFVGHYSKPHMQMTAAAAAAEIRLHTGFSGIEVVLPRHIRRQELLRVYRPNRNAGRRYWPESKGTAPCPCQVCQYAEPKWRKIRLDDY